MSGSRVSAKIAGTESIAKMMSLASKHSNAAASGVAQILPSFLTKKWYSCNSLVTGKRRRNDRITKLRSGRTGSPELMAIWTPVKIRNAPKNSTIQ